MHQIIIQSNVAIALAEDIGSGDITANLLTSDLHIKAHILTREPMLLCGQAWVTETFRQIDEHIELNWVFPEGEWVPFATTLCYIQGNARAILSAERTALNFLQVLAATATQTRAYLQQLSGFATRLLDTRKTLPGLRYAQKYAVACAGGVNHRMGLYDAYLIKENHIKACGSIITAIALARAKDPNKWVEVEVETLDELQTALLAKPDRILLDNFSIQQLQQAVNMNQPKVCALEASGGITLNNVRSVAATGVDYVAVGDITKSIRAIDLSLLCT